MLGFGMNNRRRMVAKRVAGLAETWFLLIG